MNSILQSSGNYFDSLFNPKKVRKVELLILRVAVFAFLLNLLVIFLGNNFHYFRHFQHSYLKAIYTPFSFILFYILFSLYFPSNSLLIYYHFIRSILFFSLRLNYFRCSSPERHFWRKVAHANGFSNGFV